jgi:hypothetical protein
VKKPAIETLIEIPALLPAAGMKIEMWPIDRPVPYPKNARKWSGHAIAKVAASIKEFGWVQPIVADLKDVIIIGHLRQAAARYLGLTEVPVHVPLNLTPAQVKALRIADNRTHEEASWDTKLLGVELIELKIEQFDLDVTGFEEIEIIESVFGGGGKKQRQGGGKNSRAAEAGEDETGRIDTRFEVLAECDSEEHQVAALELLTAAGYRCKALL